MALPSEKSDGANPLHIDDRIRLKAIIENAIDGIITIDTRGVMEMVNPSAARLFGYEAGELLGKSINMLMPQRNDF